MDSLGEDRVVEVTERFERERPRLTGIATRLLGDRVEAEDLVQQAWLRLHATTTEVHDLPAWLTTVTTRLCLDRLKARVPVAAEVPERGPEPGSTMPDPAEEVALADTVGAALQVVLERLSPAERVAFVLHDSFGVEFGTIAAVLDTSPVAARKLASRARAKVRQPAAEDALADWELVDAFMSAAREGDFDRLLALLAPDAAVTADAAAVLLGTPEHLSGREQVAGFFDGAAHAALPVYVAERPAAAWYDRGVARVVFDFTLGGGLVRAITFRADPATLAQVVRRSGADRRPPAVTRGGPESSIGQDHERSRDEDHDVP